MRPLRLRLRTILILVLIAALGLGVAILWRRSVEFGRKADVYERLEILSKSTAMLSGSLASTVVERSSSVPALLRRPESTEYEQMAREARWKQAYFAALKEHYRRAARRPWLSAPPEPPPPR